MIRRLLPSVLLAITVIGVVASAFFGPSVTTGLGFGSVLLAYASVGWLVARKHPANPIGWLLLIFGVLGSGMGFAWAWSTLAQQASLPGASLANWTETWIWAPAVGVVVGPLLVLFPTGRLLSPRWRFVLWSSALFVLLAGVSNALYPTPPAEGGPNPYAWVAAEAPLRAIRDFSAVFLLLSIIGGVAALITRYRRGDDIQRRQLKWFVAAAIFFPVALTIGDLRNQFLQDIALPLGLSLIAVATGIAILRHGLYDIDRIISRTVSWALVTVAIGGIYLLTVTLLTSITANVAGESTLAVAGSTLLAAAAFGPVRRRIQTAVDQRFNRARYDATRTVEAYRVRLRDDLDVESVSTHLQGAIAATLQPTASVLWLRAPEVKS